MAGFTLRREGKRVVEVGSRETGAETIDEGRSSQAAVYNVC
jgi:hypothetical protein